MTKQNSTTQTDVEWTLTASNLTVTDIVVYVFSYVPVINVLLHHLNVCLDWL